MVNTRINGFDALRAVAMWLGVVLHSIIVYKSEAEPNWPHEKESYHVLNVVYEFIHTFRMPLFYMVAGFFSCMVIAKSGIFSFLKQRSKRILVPFLAGIIIIVPLSLFPFSLNQYYFFEQMSLSDAFSNSVHDLLKWKGMAHLWFLYYLILFYCIATVTVRVFRFIPVPSASIAPWAQIAPALLLLLITIASVLIYYQAYLPPVYTGVKPNIFFLIYYGSFFMFGWWLFRLPALLKVIGRSGHVLLLAGLLLFIVRMNHLYTPASLLSFAGAGIETCLLVLGITGLFLKYFNNESKTWRYFSDASYWVYLTHLFIVSSTQVAFLTVTGIPSWLKLIIVLAVAFGITMFTYQKFVRKTIIGEFLHGKRTS